jgi:hypothetical protein
MHDTFSMTQQVVLKNSFAIAVIVVLQLVTPTAVAVGCLEVAVLFYGGLAPGANVHVLALIVALVTLVLDRTRMGLLSDPATARENPVRDHAQAAPR